MIKHLKVIASLTILLCMFLPLAQCSMQTPAKVDVDTGEVISPSQTIEKEVVVSSLVLGDGAEISFWSLIIPVMFFVPLILSLLPTFSSWKKVSKSIVQVLFSIWFVYSSYELVFTLGSPLKAGWVLMSGACLFLILCFIELIPMKHNKIKNENASVAGTDAQKDARPF